MNDENSRQEEAPNVSGATEEANLPGSNAEAELSAVAAERDQLAVEKAELNDRLLRLRAEFDNFRRRTERERSEYIQFSAMEVVREILPVLDDFERALKTSTPDKDYVRGMELIYQRLLNGLKKLGLEPLECTGKLFDPHQHEAIDRVHTDEVEENTVVEECQRGYNFKGKLLRPSMVRVAVKP